MAVGDHGKGLAGGREVGVVDAGDGRANGNGEGGLDLLGRHLVQDDGPEVPLH